jgi:AcrR family transcriptional regulator
MTEDREGRDDRAARGQRPKRRYDSTRRQVQARATRRQILEAARQLFTTRGYTGTTVEALAREAGVAVETVYATFGSKRTVLARLVDYAVGGDEEPIALLDRPGPQHVRAERDQQRQITLFAQDMAALVGRVGPLFEVMRGAALTEPEIAELLQRLLTARRSTMTVFVQWLESNGPLRSGLSPDDAADTVWALSSAEVHHLLTVDRGWPSEHYEQWLGDALNALLLPPSVPEHG